MKQFLLSTACLLMAAASSFAQEETDMPAPPPRHERHIGESEVIIGHGFFPGGQIYSGSNINGVTYNDARYTGAIYGTYRYHAGHVISIGLTAAFEYEHGTCNNNYYYNNYMYGGYTSYPSGYYSGTYSRYTYTIAPEVTFNYCDLAHGHIRLYGTVGIGYTFRNEQIPYLYGSGDATVTSLNVNGYVSPIGIRFGGRLCGFFELGTGYKGVFTYGLSYRL